MLMGCWLCDMMTANSNRDVRIQAIDKICKKGEMRRELNQAGVEDCAHKDEQSGGGSAGRC